MRYRIFAWSNCVPSEKAMAPHSSTLAWKIPWTEEPGRLQSMGSLHFHFSLSCIGEGNGNPLQRSCPENPRDGGAWWAAIYGVTQSRTQLKQLSSSSSSRVTLVTLRWEKQNQVWEDSRVQGERLGKRLEQTVSSDSSSWILLPGMWARQFIVRGKKMLDPLGLFL